MEPSRIIALGIILSAVVASIFFIVTERMAHTTIAGATSAYGTPTSTTATGTSAATSTLVGAAGRTIYVTDVTASTDLSGATIKIKDGSSTVIWQDSVGSTTAYSHTFSTPLRSSAGNNITVTINGTSVSNTNISGYYAP